MEEIETETLRNIKSTAPSANSLVSAHTNSGHNINWEGVKVLEKDNRSDTWKIREAILIRKDPNAKINTSQGFKLSSIYNSLLRSENKSLLWNISRNTGFQLLTNMYPLPLMKKVVGLEMIWVIIFSVSAVEVLTFYIYQKVVHQRGNVWWRNCIFIKCGFNR